MTLTFEDAFKLQDVYRPTDETVVEELGTITLMPAVGPSAAGKNYQMSLLSTNLGYHQAGNLVSRELRSSDPANVLHGSQEEFLEMIEKGRLIQFAAILGSRALYGTSIENYQTGKINTKDIFAHSISGFTNYGFKAVRPVGVLAPPDKWEARLDERFSGIDSDQIQTRLDEARQSIKWIIEGSPDMPHTAIISDDTHEHVNIERVQAFVESGQNIALEQIHYDTAEQMLDALPSLHKKYLGGSQS